MSNQKLPKNFARFFEWFCKPELFDELQGDLEEAFEENKKELGIKSAQKIYRMEVLKMIRPSVIRFGQTHSKFNHLIMFNNYFKTSWRSLLKRKSYFLINVFGLALGLASFSLISLFVLNEVTYDQFHSKHARIHRVSNKSVIRGESNHSATTNAPMANVLKADYPEVIDATRILDPGSLLVGRDKPNITETNVLYSDSSFFHIFDFNLIKGNPKTVLSEPGTVALSQRMANKYFGTEEAIGQWLKIEHDTILYKVTGIFNDVPPNSHLQFDMLASLSSRKEYNSTYWIGSSLYTYVVLREDVDIPALQKKTKDIFYKYLAPEIEYYTGLTIKDWETAGNSVGFAFTPIKDIHLYSTATEELEATANVSYIYIYALIGIVTLLVAIFNFVNLATAHAASRAKEVGIRKVIGSSRRMLITQFIVESMIVSFVAMIVALLLIAFLVPGFHELVQKEVAGQLFYSATTYVYAFVLAVTVGVLAGLYPAFALSRFAPVRVLKGSTGTGKSTGWLRNFLVTLQFAVSIFIIVCTTVVYRQIDYMLVKSLGFEKDQVLVIERPDWLGNDMEAFKNDLFTHPNISTVSNSATLPGKKYELRSYRKKGEAETFLFLNNQVSYEYQDLLGLELVAGRFFSDQIASDSSAVIINESAANTFGFDDPVGQSLTSAFASGPLHIIGVVKDYNFESLHKPVVPLTLELFPKVNNGYLSVKLNSGLNLSETVEFIDEKWSIYASDKPLQYFFFDDDYDRIYKSEMAIGKILSIFATLSILIAGMGLIGLISYMAANRQKEIGIRKVLGATIGSLFGLLSNHVFRLILIAVAISWPIAFVAGEYWLQNFADRQDPGIWIYLASTFLIVIIVSVVVGLQTFKSASSNPVDSLRQE